MLKSTLLYLFFLVSFGSVAVPPNATILNPGSTNSTGIYGFDISIQLSGTLPMSISMDGKVYSNINEPVLQLGLNVNASRYYVIDSIWNIDGKSYKTDSVLINFTKSGPNVQSQERLIGSGYDSGFSYFGTQDGGTFVAINTGSDDKDYSSLSGAGSGVLIRKYKNDASLDWETFLNFSSYKATGNSAIPCSDGSFLIVGHKIVTRSGIGSTDVWACKLSNTGSVLWERLIGGLYYDYGFDCIESKLGGFIICGRSESNDDNFGGQHGGMDGALIKLRNDGTILWTKLYGGSLWEEYFSVTENSLNEIYVGGYSKSSNGNLNNNQGDADLFVSKLNSDGNTIWHKSFGGSQFETVKSLAMTTDDSVLVAYDLYSNDFISSKTNGGADAALMKIDQVGNVYYNAIIPGVSGFNTSIKKILCTVDNDYIVAAQTTTYSPNNKGFKLNKLSSNETFIWSQERNLNWNEEILDFNLSNDKIQLAIHFNTNNLASNYFNNQNIDLLQLDLCPSNDVSLNGSVTMAKFDTLAIPFQYTQATFPISLLMNNGFWHTINSPADELNVSPAMNTVYQILYGFDACTFVPNAPSNSLTVNVTNCPGQRNLGMILIQNATFQATEFIEMDGPASNYLNLEAGKAVTLLPGFKSAAENFKAEIKNCIE